MTPGPEATETERAFETQHSSDFEMVSFKCMRPESSTQTQSNRAVWQIQQA